jgi:gliding motility-associated-like protein
MKNIALLVLTTVLAIAATAQDFSNKGKLFYVTYPAHIDGTGSAMGLYLTSDLNATGTVTVGTTVINFTVTANNVTRIFIGPNASGDAPNTYVYLSQNEGIKTGAAIKIESDKPIVVYSHIIRSARSGATLVLPVPVWGQEYIMPSYPNSGSSQGYGALSVVAAEANTVVEITPKVNSRDGARPAGVPFQITLVNPGDVFQLQFALNQDLSGTTVKSVSSGTGGCKKIAVFSSTTWSGIGCSNATGGDNLYQQLFPTGAWGKQFVTAPFKTRTSDIIRVFVKDPTTVVKKTENGIVTTLTGLQGNSYYEFTTGNPTVISADKAVSVVMYIKSQSCQSPNVNSDPEMVLINPIEQTINNITVFSAHQNYVPAGQSQVTNCYLNIILKTAAISSFKINNAAPTTSFATIPGTPYSYLQQEVTSLALTNPVHTLTADSGFIAIAYGFGNVESYGYNAGTNVIDRYQYASVSNTYGNVNVPATCKGSPFKLSITLPYQPTSIQWDFNGNANISPNANVAINSPVFDSSFVRDDKTLYVYKLPGNYVYTPTGTPTYPITVPVKVIVNNPTSDGCSGNQEISLDISVYDLPTANFSFTTTGCVTDSIRFSDGSDGKGRAITKWKWDFGNGTIDSVKNPVRLFPAAGSFSTQLLAITDIGCGATVAKTVNVTNKPDALFNIGTACVNKNVTFTDASQLTGGYGSIVKYEWDYGNTVKETVNNNSVRNQTFTSFGTYIATLQIETSTGCRDTLSKNFTVGANPQVGFIVPEVCLTDPFAQFTDTSKIADNSTLTYLWNFGEPGSANPTSPDKNPKHSYAAPGTYNVTLTVTSALGCSASTTTPFTVSSTNPIASFVLLNTNQPFCSNIPVQIKNTSTVQIGAIGKVEIYWDYLTNPTVVTVDNDPAFNEVYTHAYPIQNTDKPVRIRFLAYSGGVCVNEVFKDTILYATPAISYTTMPGICNEALPRQITQFTALPTGGAFQYSGIGVNNTGLFNPQTSGVGTFAIKALYGTNRGCKDSLTRNITVWPSPTATWVPGSLKCEKNGITFTTTALANFGKITSWIWTFGDMTTATYNNGNAFTKTYANAGPYNATLKVVTDSGCTATSPIQAIVVNPLPKVSFDPPLQTSCLPTAKATFNSTSTIADNSETLFSYYWTFGDPNDPTPAAVKSPTHIYTQLATPPGYAVKLKVTSKDLCVDSLMQYFSNIKPQPIASFKPDTNQICINDTIFFTDKSNPVTGSIAKWFWRLGDGATAANASPFHKYTDSGTFTVRLYIQNTDNCFSDTFKLPVKVFPYPVLNAGPDINVLEGGSAVLNPDYFARTGMFKWAPALYLDNDAIARPTTRPLADILYTVTLTGEGGCAVSDDIFVKLLLKPVIPNAFTPNGDGINDTWVITYLESYPGATVEVFDRNGHIVFRSLNYGKNWDGTNNGKPLPVGTYYYIIDPKNGRPQMSGNVTIVR